MQVGRREGGCDDRHEGRVHHGLCEGALHDDDDGGWVLHDEGETAGVGDGEALLESPEGCEGWASETRPLRHEVVEVEGERCPRVQEVVVGVEVRDLCDRLCHDDGQVRGVREEDHVFCHEEPKDPRIAPDPRKD